MYKAKIFTSKVHYGLDNKASWLYASPFLVSTYSLKNIMTTGDSDLKLHANI